MLETLSYNRNRQFGLELKDGALAASSFSLSCRYHQQQHPINESSMSDLNVTVASLKSLETPKDAAVTSFKDTNQEAQQVKLESKQDKLAKQPTPSKLTDLNYSIDREDNALHLKVKSTDGEVIREVVFDRIDPNLLNPKKLKGVFVDGNS